MSLGHSSREAKLPESDVKAEEMTQRAAGVPPPHTHSPTPTQRNVLPNRNCFGTSIFSVTRCHGDGGLLCVSSLSITVCISALPPSSSLTPHEDS